jgi:hypothetical protein
MNMRTTESPYFRYRNISMIPARAKNSARRPRMAKMLEV